MGHLMNKEAGRRDEATLKQKIGNKMPVKIAQQNKLQPSNHHNMKAEKLGKTASEFTAVGV